MITGLSHTPVARSAANMAGDGQPDRPHARRLQAYFAERPEIETIGIYVEGSGTSDGLGLRPRGATAVRQRQDVVVYKAGRTPAGGRQHLRPHGVRSPEATSFSSPWCGHAGAMVAPDVTTFDDIFLYRGARCTASTSAAGGSRGSAAPARGGQHGRLDPRPTALRAGDGRALEAGDRRPPARDPSAAQAAGRAGGGQQSDRTSIPAPTTRRTCRWPRAFLQDPNIDAVVVALDPTAPAVPRGWNSEASLRPGSRHLTTRRARWP